MLNILNGKLDKMEFRFYDKKTNSHLSSFKAMYNPQTLEMGFSKCLDEGEAILKGTQNQKLRHINPRTLKVKLTFDGTNASPSTAIFGSLPQQISEIGNIKEEPINKRINEFIDLAFSINGDKHDSLKMQVIWGTIYFPCVLKDASVTYKLFKHDGTPIRADLTVTLLEQKEQREDNAKLNLLSPDLTRSHLVVKGDRIDVLCEKYYGDPSLYQEIARVNKLTNKRQLKPGNTLIFPPIDKGN